MPHARIRFMPGTKKPYYIIGKYLKVLIDTYYVVTQFNKANFQS